MADPFLLLLAILSCYRIAMLVTQDSIFKPVRNYIGLHPWNWVRTYGGELVHCPYCFGVWTSAAITLTLYGPKWTSLLYWMAIAGGQAFLQKLSDGAYGLEELGDQS